MSATSKVSLPNCVSHSQSGQRIKMTTNKIQQLEFFKMAVYKQMDDAMQKNKTLKFFFPLEN